MSNEKTPLSLEERFTKPDGWRWHNFVRDGRKIRFGSVFPQDSIPDAVIVCLQGVKEFSEKYYETARWCLDNNFAFWIMDWAGQGKSMRYLKNPQKRHSASFDEDIKDLHYFILEYIKHSSVHPDKGRIPLAMLAHSMGSNIGLRYIYQHPQIFECAAFSAPMISIKAFEKVPQPLALTATFICKMLMGHSYIPHGKDWEARNSDDYILSSDPIRSTIYDKWCESDPDLRCGEVTFGWLYEAQKSCMALKQSIMKQENDVNCIFALPQNEYLVSNKIATQLIKNIKNSQTIDFPNAYHEILMEKDEIRDSFLNAFYNKIKENIIDRPESLKPF